MKKNSILLVMAFFLTHLSFAQLMSPEKFLGYPVGSRYSPHFKVVDYFKHVASQLPGMVKLEQYGATNEGRPLLLTYISTPEHISNLDAIRRNNLKLAAQGTPGDKGDLNTPAIVWLSYNVHGNETSSSEAAMLTLWELVNPENAKTKQWLKNTLVMMDPCINPDGRDRYVNWFNSVVGAQPNPQPFAREHMEPWPGGRSNHYYFDLNRDWAWQSQIETQQRIIKYNQWLPQVHVDFHEQGYNSPYYFAPAAEPYHEVITPWQRDFQVMIGKNNAAYFDAKGWLFFTKERFDLFYPSYGDTYPTYKGAIGMTFEQGGIRSGTAIINQDGDTLTLMDRVMHHFTTGLSTIEVSANNAANLLREFKAYYEQANTAPSGMYKAFLLKEDGSDRLKNLKAMLDRNGIVWGETKQASFTGYNYFSGKQESITSTSGDIVVNLQQPNANLVRVLFEPNAKITDSATYDITAWSVPFVYGVQAYGLNQPVSIFKSSMEALSSTAALEYSTSPLGCAIRWKGISSAKTLAALLKKGYKVRYAEQDFQLAGKKYDKGTLLILRTSNQQFGNRLLIDVKDIAHTFGLEADMIMTGFVDKGYDFGSSMVHTIKAPRITLLSGEGVSSLGMGEVWHFLEQQLKYPVSLVNTTDLNKNILQNTDVLIVADGRYKLFSEKASNDLLKEWVNAGGKLIAMENAVALMARSDWGIKMKSASEEKQDAAKNDAAYLKSFEDREKDFLTTNNPGSIFKVTLDNTHPLGFGYPDFYYTLKQDDLLYDYFKSDGWNVGVIKNNGYVTGYVGSKLKPSMKDALLFGVQEMGRGSVVYLADDVLFRSFWENGKLLFSNALFFVGQ